MQKSTAVRVILFGLLLSAPLQAQTFTPVSGGSRFICGYLPDGSSKIYEDNNGNYEAVDFKDAQKEVNKDKSRIKVRIERLKEIRKEVKESSTVVGKDLKDVGKEIKAFNQGKTEQISFGKTKKDKLDAIDRLVSNLELSIKNKQSELDGLKKCNDNVRDNPGNIEARVITIRNANGGVIAVKILLLVTSKKAPGYCIRRTTETPGTSYYQTFKANPCEGESFLNGLDCTNFVPKGNLGKLNTGHVWSNPPSDDEASAAYNELALIVAQGFSGVPAKDFNCDYF